MVALVQSALLVAAAACGSIAHAASLQPRHYAASVTCGSKAYTYNSLAGYGYVAHDAKDEFGDTISLGSSIAISKWKKESHDKYTGTLYGLPDRGWNTDGTQNTIPRVHVFEVSFLAKPGATVQSPAGPNLQVKYKKSILLTSPDGKFLSGLDPDQSGGTKFPGFPVLPTATYPGDGFGGGDNTTSSKRVTLDAEGLFLGEDDSFWISDEYGPFVYKFDKKGRMEAALQPPDAILPLRRGSVSFSSDNPPIYDENKHPSPANPTQGRQNNQGFEGLTVSPDGKFLYVLLQSAARQEGGSNAATRRNTRFLKYAISTDKKACHPVTITYLAEWVVPLPTFKTAANQTRVAAQSEVHYISDTQFLVLPRDSSVGRGYEDAKSVYRHVDIIDITGATNIKDKYDAFNASITAGNSSDVLKPDIKPATLCPFIDFNLNSELGKFTAQNGNALHNGLPVNLGLLNEKWEGLALVPVNDEKDGRDVNDEYYLVAVSDNDFISSKGFMNGGKIPFVDTSLPDKNVTFLDSQILVFKVTLPKGSKPLIA